MSNYLSRFVVAFIVFLFVPLANAAAKVDTNRFWSEARVFATSSDLGTSPDALNALTAGDSVESLSKITGFGIEGNFNVAAFMKFGLRAGGIWTKKESTVPTNKNSFLAVQQGSGGAIVRIPIVRSDAIQFDVFGEGGLTVSHIDVSTMSSGAGTFTKSYNPYERAGASLGVGFTPFYLFVEGGYMWNKLETMSYSGTMTTSISTLDLSGTYLAVGIIINGVPGFLNK